MSKSLYRSRNGMLFGVCQGIANYFDVSVVWIRLTFVIAFAFTFFFPTGFIYLALAVIMKKEPGTLSRNATTKAAYSPAENARTVHLRQLKEKFSSLENRIRRMESHVTDKAYDWEKRLNGEP